MKLIFIILSVIFLYACSTVPEPRFDSVAASAPEAQLLEQARRLFGAGEYVQARTRAEQALALNSASAEALFAIAASWFGMEEYRNSIAAARQAARYRSDLLPDIYLLLGAAYERLDERWQALRTLRYGSQRYADNALLHYRLALMYIRLDKPELAADTLKTVLRLEPLNPDPHFQLGMLYADHGYRTPALLALGTALVLEPREGPVILINETIDALLGQGVMRDAVSGAFTVLPEAASKNDEGDFAASDAELSKVRASLLNQGVGADAPAMLRAQYRALCRAIQTVRGEPGKQPFVMEFYIPLYRTLCQSGLDEAFVNRMFEGRQDPEFRQWIAQHPAQAARLQQTIKGYNWPER